MENNSNQLANPSVTPVQTPVPQHPIKNPRGNFPIILGVLVLLLVVGGGAYYLGIQNGRTAPQAQNISIQPTAAPQNHTITNPTTTPITTNKTPKIERIVLQEGYYFDATIPEGYSLKEGSGDYAKYVVDAEGKEVIGFQKSWGGGEMSKTYPVTIDNVPLVIMYRKEIGCPADIFSEKANNPQKMSFGIMTGCKDEKETQLPVYKAVIESIVFGPELRDVLLGSKPAPSIQ
jgi:hypothetical protein